MKMSSTIVRHLKKDLKSSEGLTVVLTNRSLDRKVAIEWERERCGFRNGTQNSRRRSDKFFSRVLVKNLIVQIENINFWFPTRLQLFNPEWMLCQDYEEINIILFSMISSCEKFLFFSFHSKLKEKKSLGLGRRWQHTTKTAVTE